MKEVQKIVCFSIDKQLFALPLHFVDRVMQAVAVRPVPNAPPFLTGLMDYHGITIPVINLRFRLKLPDRPIRAGDYFLIVDTSIRKLALIVDEPGKVIFSSVNDWTKASELDPGLEATGILRSADGIILIYDLETFISGQEDELIQHIIDNDIVK